MLEQLTAQVRKNIYIKPLTDNKIQVWLPVYYEDGDMIDIYVDQLGDGRCRITDSGMTLMKLSYTYDINTDNKRRILNQIIEANGLSYQNGVISKVVSLDDLYKEIVVFSNTVIRVSTMSYFKREMIKNLFYEMVEEFVQKELAPSLTIEKQYMPIFGKEEYTVDYRIVGKKEIFLYAVKDTSKARLVTICEQTFRLNKLDSDSIVVYEDFGIIQSNDQKRILNATGKQFTSLDEFQSKGPSYIMKRVSGWD